MFAFARRFVVAAPLGCRNLSVSTSLLSKKPHMNIGTIGEALYYCEQCCVWRVDVSMSRLLLPRRAVDGGCVGDGVAERARESVNVGARRDARAARTRAAVVTAIGMLWRAAHSLLIALTCLVVWAGSERRARATDARCGALFGRNCGWYTIRWYPWILPHAID